MRLASSSPAIHVSEFHKQIGQKEFPYFVVLLKTSTLRATPLGSVIVAYYLHGAAG